jgi:hypothetical protein
MKIENTSDTTTKIAVDKINISEDLKQQECKSLK